MSTTKFGWLLLALCLAVALAQPRVGGGPGFDEAYWRAADYARVARDFTSPAQARTVLGGGYAPLHMAAALTRDPRVVRHLVRLGADPNRPTENGYTPLLLAIVNNGEPAVVQALVESGARLDAVDGSGRTPLHYAAALGKNPEVLRLLVHLGADPNAADAKGMTPLHAAAMQSRDARVFELLVRQGAALEARTRSGLTPLMVAIGSGNAEGVEALLRLGANPLLGDRLGRTALHFAAQLGRNPEVLRVLVRYGLDVSRSTADRLQPIHFAAHNPEPAIVEELVRLGADVNALDAYRWTPLMRAAERNPNPEVVLTLLRLGADPAWTDPGGVSALDLLLKNDALKGSEAERELRRRLGR